MNKKLRIIILAIALTLALVPIISVEAKKPLRLEVSGELASYGWIGTIHGGPLDGHTMKWIIDFENYELKGQVGLFQEVWEIYDGDTLVLAGYDTGVTRYKNGKFTGNGRVTYATTEWAHLIGSKEHISGTADFTTTPWSFTGMVQING